MNSLVFPVLLPVLTALVGLSMGPAGRNRRVLFALSAAIQLLVALFLTGRAFTHGPLVLLLGDWAAPLGIVLVVDALAGIMLCLSTVVALACILFGFSEVSIASEQPLRLPLVQFLIAGINLTFLTGDLFNLFVAFEIMLIASYALLTLEANDRDIKQAFPYLAVNLFGSGLFLAAAGFAYALFGTLNLAHLAERMAAVPDSLGVWLLAMLLLVVFGIKTGIFPLYFWLPNSYPILPPSLGALYSGMLTKVGVYVFLRMLGTVFPHSLHEVHTLLAWLAAPTMVVAVLGAISRNYIRGILSYHILSQIGYMVLAIGLFTPFALAACVFYVIHHIIVKSSLFLIAGAGMFQCQTDHLSRMGGLWKSSPLLGVCFLLQAFSLAGVPPLSGFWGKYMIVLAGLEEGYYWLVAAAILASILTTVSMLKIWFGAFWQDPPEGASVRPVNVVRPMVAVIGIMTLVSLGIGLGAELFLGISKAAAESLLDQQGYQDAVFQQLGKGSNP